MNSFRFGLILLWAGLATAAPGWEDAFFDANDVRIRYVQQGTGEPVVLVHGYTSWFEQNWHRATNGVFENLARDYRVIALDCRGHGKSDKPHDPKQYGAEMAHDVIRLLDHLGIRKAHLVGYSMGTRVALRLLVEQPERFSSATLAAGGGQVGWSRADEELAEREAAEMERREMRSLMLRLRPPDLPQPTEDDLRSLAASVLTGQDVRALAAVRRGYAGFAVTPAQAKAVTVPLLGLVGSADPARTDLQKFQNLQPSLKLVILDGATHGAPRAAVGHAEFLPALRAFLAANRMSGGSTGQKTP
jgi:pimeloyl-ACP methyl ester carboxylesterase